MFFNRVKLYNILLKADGVSSLHKPMFSKIDKKVLTVALILLVIILAVGLFAYKSLNIQNPEVENSLGGVNTESPEGEGQQNFPSENNQPINVEAETNGSQSGIQIEAEATNGGGTLTMCLDECGNGVCQAKDDECAKTGSNCVCPETSADCPTDCK